MRTSSSTMRWKVEATAPARLTKHQWSLVSLLGAILVIAAILQLISFNDFRDNLSNLGLSSPTTWGVLIILAELWGAANFFKLRLSHLFRVVSVTLAVLVAGFWFIESLQVVANNGQTVQSMGFFGGLLNQTPGWWTVVEASLLLFWTLYAVNLTRPAIWSDRR
jgi:hypothetical protein